MSFIKKIFGGNRKKAESLRAQVLEDFQNDLQQLNIDLQIDRLNEAIKLDKKNLGQYKSIAALYNKRCKKRIEEGYSNHFDIHTDAVAGLLAMKHYLSFSGNDHGAEVVLSELQQFAKSYSP